MTFPLYDNLFNNLPETDLSVKEKEFVIKQIKKFDITIHERIYALIRCFQLNNSRDVSIIPYDGKSSKIVNADGSGGNNMTFNLDKFPNQLKHMIHKFCKIEIEVEK